MKNTMNFFGLVTLSVGNGIALRTATRFWSVRTVKGYKKSQYPMTAD